MLVPVEVVPATKEKLVPFTTSVSPGPITIAGAELNCAPLAADGLADIPGWAYAYPAMESRIQIKSANLRLIIGILDSITGAISRLISTTITVGVAPGISIVIFKSQIDTVHNGA